MSRAQRHTDAATEVADWLDRIGEPKRANDVRAVCRSLGTARRTMSDLHRDNSKLRNRFCVSDQQMLAKSGIGEDVLAIELDAELIGPLKERLEAECAQRKIEPAALLADLLTTIVNDDLFAAVLD